MHIDLNHASAPQRLCAQICVVGGGAAGITVARRLLRLGHEVTLLESGGLDYEPAIASLNAGSNIGEDYYELEDARLRLFGGTTAIWGGRVAELDPIDLEARPWVAHSGWPIRWPELARYYPQARKIFEIPEHPATAHDLVRSGVRIPLARSGTLEVGMWDFDRRFNRFQFDACKDLSAHPRCTILTHATVTALNLRPGGHDIESLTVRSLGGRTLALSAQVIVLAAGGLENPRLLLASRAVTPAGVGNDYGLVGRFFMEHPHARGGRIVGAGAWTLLNAFSRPHRIGRREVAALLKPSARQQQERGILNTSLTIAARQAAEDSRNWGMRAYSRLKHGIAPTRRGRALWMSAKKTATWLQHRTDPLRPWLLHKLGLREVALVVRAEQAPNPLSRVTLTDQLDPLGMPRVALDWHLSRLDIESVVGLVDLLGAEIQAHGLGRVEAARWLRDGGAWQTDLQISAHPIGGYHHMGTTRMADDPRRGVTDAWGRVYGVENLYIVGSSVFPTSGWANPTLTVLALALRTSDRISTRMARRAAA
jgi:choline dehydrogenase-like flavoprotein